jgi:hypothetical protein
MLTAKLLRDAVPGIRITESHPKALLWLLGVLSAGESTTGVGLRDLGDHLAFAGAEPSEHERDAALGALTAAAMLERSPGWRDILVDEEDAFCPVPDISYWMPLTDKRFNLTRRSQR